MGVFNVWAFEIINAHLEAEEMAQLLKCLPPVLEGLCSVPKEHSFNPRTGEADTEIPGVHWLAVLIGKPQAQVRTIISKINE